MANSKHHFLDQQTIAAIAVHGTDQHREHLLKHHDLDDKAQMSIVDHGSEHHVNQMIKHHKLSDDLSNYVANRGTNYNRGMLLRHQQLSINVKHTLAFRGSEQICDILVNHPTNETTKLKMAQRSSHARTEFLKDPKLPDSIKLQIANYGDHNHHHQLITNHQLDHITKYSLSSHADKHNLKRLVDNHTDFDDKTKNVIKQRMLNVKK